MTINLPSLSSLAKRLHPHTRGKLAEKVAWMAYTLSGWQMMQPLKQNLAQTDLVMVKGCCIALVEVKFRMSREKGHVALKNKQVERLNRQMVAVGGKFPKHTVRLEVFLVFPHYPFIQRIQTPYI